MSAGQTASGAAAWDALARLVDGPAVVSSVREIIESARETGVAPRMRIVGPPGSGRSSVARLIGPLLEAEGILEWQGGFETSAILLSDRMAEVVRQAHGGTLIVQDAPDLRPSVARWGADVAEALLAEMVSDEARGTALVLVGEATAMTGLGAEVAGFDALMSDVVTRPGFDVARCLALLRTRLAEGERPQSVEDAFVEEFTRRATSASAQPDFDNGAWVMRLLDAARSSMRVRVMADPAHHDGAWRRRLLATDLPATQIDEPATGRS